MMETTAIIAIKAIPPTTPPMMGPNLLVLELDFAKVSVELEEVEPALMNAEQQASVAARSGQYEFASAVDRKP